ncbi:MAG: toll/interleukin-1 receptor domain-containing protein, partial [Hyphomicrobiales bacterium]|nr:toll/interleukin-1 receptor domain-containing protein [Hyphomicrobiales bacterium]
MSYLGPDFNPDIFVSYSHGRLLEGRAPLRDWTQALIRRLQYLLSLDSEFDDLGLWMDPQIDPTAFLTGDLKAKASGCGVLMIVMSGRYLESTWCRDELEWFQQQVQDRRGAGGRIFVLRAQKTDTGLWPEFLRDERGHTLKGFSFYDTETGQPWDFPDLREPNAEFGRELSQLHVWLTKRLRELRLRAGKKTGDVHAQAAAPQSTGPRLVYLHAPPEGDAARREIGGVLSNDGFEPLTAQGATGDVLADWETEAKQRITMARHCEALALLRVGDASRFLNDLLGIGVEERKRISGSHGGPLPCAVLDKIGGGLPIDLARFGIARFDVNQPGRNNRFRSWLDASHGAAA